MERYHQSASTLGLDPRGSSNIDDYKSDYDAGIKTTKPSGMYRFGKALVSAFNPVNVWQGINGIWKDKEHQTLPEKSLLQARKARAEEAYAEMKRNGFKGTQPFSSRTAIDNYFQLNSGSSQGISMDSSHRNSDAQTDQPLTPVILRHGRPTPTGSEDFLIPPMTTEPRPPPPSPVSQGKHGRKTSIDIHRPSFQSLKKAKSHMQLPSTKRKLNEAMLSPSVDAIPNPNIPHALKRRPSRKEIAKQRKLSKQVSDLEGKLEVARRELQLCTGEIPETPASRRKPFKPGALPSFPSESNMKSTDSNAQDLSDPDWQPSSSRQKRTRNSTPKESVNRVSAVKTPAKAAQPQPYGQSPVTSCGKKRKSSSGRASDSSYKIEGQTTRDSDSDKSASAKRIPRARQSQKLNGSLAAQNSEARSQQSTAGVSKGSSGGPPKEQASVPSVPTFAAPFDPATVDKNKLLAMRSIPKDNLPFGSHLDDIVNLQKEFPHCSQKELDKYLSCLSQGHKAEAQPGGVGHQKAATPQSGQSDSASPTKASRADEIVADTRQGCKNSSPNKKIGRELSTIDEAVTVDPSKDKSVPPMPTTFFKKTQITSSSNGSKAKPTDKPLPNIQKENYDWPEDVF